MQTLYPLNPQPGVRRTDGRRAPSRREWVRDQVCHAGPACLCAYLAAPAVRQSVVRQVADLVGKGFAFVVEGGWRKVVKVAQK